MRAATLVHSLNVNSRICSVLSKLPPSPSFQSLIVIPMNYASSRTSLFLARYIILILPLITSSPPTIFLVPGAHSMPCVSRLPFYLLARKEGLEMFQRPTAWLEHTTPNGLERWFVLAMTSLQLIPASPLGKPQVPGLTVLSRMLVRTSIELKALGLCLNGWTITASCESFLNLSQNTTTYETPTESRLRLTEACDNLAVAYGGKEMTSQTAVNPSLMRISGFPSATSPAAHRAHHTMFNLLTTSWTSMISLRSSAFLGRSTKTYLSPPPFPSLDLLGTYKVGRFLYQRKNVTNTWLRSKLGRRNRHISYQKCRNSMAGFSTLPVLSPWAELTSPAWKPCSQSAMTVLTCLTPLPAQLQLTSLGGHSNSANLSPGKSLLPAKFWTSRPTPTPVPVLGLELPSVLTGAPGDYSQVGTQTNGVTSNGQKQWGSNCSYELSLMPDCTANMPRPWATINPSLRAGGMAEADTSKSTSSSGVSITYLQTQKPPFTPAISPALLTQQMVLLGASIPQGSAFSLQSSCPRISNPSSLTSTLPYGHLNSNMTTHPDPQDCTPLPTCLQPPHCSLSPGSKQTSITDPNHIPDRFTSSSKPHQYLPTLTPRKSVLRPHCLARERLLKWKPLFS
ncbi:hypothetical protein ARMSODRAFT_216693 [Armillaria solidipes]|uniref:Uncharacterized protein n=1 Tax=Armillaria solidipes TaxID=1076256 RepID=A0A2H3BZC9_9AGAR|nr:hypothetical protein ARMSODRAFT_216693 [Armillaria solidipes]